MCQSLRTARGSAARTEVIMIGQAPADPSARIGDAERDATVSLLGDATAEGYLTLAELDTRLETALTARTEADLLALRADLPAEWLALRNRPAAAHASRRPGSAALRPRVFAYLLVMAVLVAIWLGGGAVTGAWYPWRSGPRSAGASAWLGRCARPGPDRQPDLSPLLPRGVITSILRPRERPVRCRSDVRRGLPALLRRARWRWGVRDARTCPARRGILRGRRRGVGLAIAGSAIGNERAGPGLRAWAVGQPLSRSRLPGHWTRLVEGLPRPRPRRRSGRWGQRRVRGRGYAPHTVDGSLRPSGQLVHSVWILRRRHQSRGPGWDRACPPTVGWPWIWTI
jgi:hypothetical protein